MPHGRGPARTSAAASRGGFADRAADAYRWWGPRYQHQNLRDERAEAFTTLLHEGAHAYNYVTRATTPGSFVAPPPKAEEMYRDLRSRRKRQGSRGIGSIEGREGPEATEVDRAHRERQRKRSHAASARIGPAA